MTAQRAQVDRVLAEADIPADSTAEGPLAPDVPPDRTRQFTHVSMSRMKRSWTQDEAMAMMDLEYQAGQLIKARFGRALRIIERILEIVQVPDIDEQTGEARYSPDGKTPLVKLDEWGDPVEDWTRFGDKQRSDALFSITVHLMEWERASASLWHEAMTGKVGWEQKFAAGFRAPPGAAISGKPTIDDRTQSGHAWSGQDRYFAVFLSAISREGEAVVKSMIRLQRLLEITAKG